MRNPEFSANISIMFTEHPLLSRPAAAAAAGFTAVEMWWPFPGPKATNVQITELTGALAGAGVRLSALNFYAGDMAGGERGVASDPGRAGELRANIADVVRIAKATGCRHFNLLYGQRDDRWSSHDQDQAALTAIRSAAEAVAPISGTVLIEPLAEGLNGAYPLTHPAQVLDLLAGPLIDVPNIRLLYDLFHLGSNGFDIVRGVWDLVDRIGHVQVADAPGRGEPGSGTLPIEEALKALFRAGYEGAVGCEYIPTGRTEDTLGWLDQWR